MPPQFERQRLDPGETGRASGSDENANLKIIAFDVGQGDATLIRSPDGKALLIDAGPRGAGRDVILPYLESEGIGSLSYILATHYHTDHIGGIAEVLSGADGIKNTADDIAVEGGIYDRGGEYVPLGNPAFEAYEEAAAGSRHAAHPGERFELGDCAVEVVAAGGVLENGTRVDPGDPPDENALSVATLLECGAFRMFIAADITGGGLDEPYTTPDVETPLSELIGDIDVLRVAHHGSASSTNGAFLAATSPEVAIISVGDGNEYFHPHESVVERLLGRGIAVHQTERAWLSLTGPMVRNQNVAIDVHDGGTYTIR